MVEFLYPLFVDQKEYIGFVFVFFNFCLQVERNIYNILLSLSYNDFNVYRSVFITFDIFEANFNSKFRVFRLFIIMLEKGIFVPIKIVDDLPS